jgi:hypothetical protein
MHFAISGSHRAFLGVSLPLIVVLSLGLAIGWRWHFKQIENRRAMIAMAAEAEAKRKSQARPVNAQRVQVMTEREPERPSILLADERPQRYEETAATVPMPVDIEALPLLNAESLFREGELCIQKYLDAPTWRDRLLYVYEPDRMRRLMEDFYETQNAVDPLIGAAMDKGHYRINDTEVLIFSFRSPRALGKLEVALRKNDAGQWVIDWESFVAYSERSFAALKQEKPLRPVLMRGMAKIDDYYNYEFSDSKAYLSLKLESPEGDEAVHAFCRRDSEMGRWLINDLGADAASSLTKGYSLWVAFPKDAQSNRCLNLVQIAAGRWLSVVPRQ